MDVRKRTVAVGATLMIGLATVAGARAIPGASAARQRPPAVEDPPSASPPELTASATASPPASRSPALRPVTSWKSTISLSDASLTEARGKKLEEMRRLFAEAQVDFPPAAMLLRAFKKDKRLELWAGSAPGVPLLHVTTFEVCALSGSLGPKRKEGDLQVPEGFYTLADWEAPLLPFPSLLVSYPNASDCLLGDRGNPGGDIMIHGRCHSKGCLSLSDEAMLEVFVTASAFRQKGGTTNVHIFPARDMATLIAETTDPALRGFWENLAEGLARFDLDHRLPATEVDEQGRYRFRQGT